MIARLEFFEPILDLQVERDLHEDGDAQIDGAWVEQRRVLPDHALLLERAHPPQARRRRKADAVGQVGVGGARVVLQRF